MHPVRIITLFSIIFIVWFFCCLTATAAEEVAVVITPSPFDLKPPATRGYVTIRLADTTWTHACDAPSPECKFCNPGPCDDPQNLTTVSARLKVGIEYSLTLSSDYCDGGESVSLTVPSCYHVETFDSINQVWVPESVFSGDDSAPGAESQSYQVRVVQTGPAIAVKVHDSSIPADFESETSATVPGDTNLSWSFEGNSLGCRIRSINGGNAAIITAGEDEGTVTIKAVSSSSGCTYYGYLELTECNGCRAGTCNAFGDGTFDNRSVHFKLSLGKSANEDESHLLLRSATPSPDLSKPILLEHPFHRDDVEVVYLGGHGLHQIYTTSGLAYIPEPATPYSYDVLFYAGSLVRGADGLWIIPPGTQPTIQWTISNPDNGSAYNRLWITETRNGSVVRTWKYTYITDTGAWELEDGLATRKISAWTETAGIVTYRKRSFSSGGVIAKLEGKGYRTISGRTVIAERFRGSGADKLTTSYSYYANTGNANYDDEVQQVTQPDGAWEIRQYDSDKRVNARYHAWGDGSPTTAITGRYRLEEMSYTILGVDDGSWKPHLPRVITTKLRKDQNNFKIVSKVFRKYVEGYEEEQQCTNPNADWDDLTNLKTSRRFYLSGDGVGRIQWQRYGNGTYSMYTYLNGGAANLTITEDRGQASLLGNEPTSIVEGTRTVTALGARGEILSKTVNGISGGATGILLESETYQYSSTDPLYRDHTV